MNITAKKISKASVFKIYIIGLGLGLFVFFLIMGLSALFGSQTVKFNGESVTGFMGLVVALCMWPIFSVIFAGFMWLISILGLWVYSVFYPITISFKEMDVENDSEQ